MGVYTVKLRSEHWWKSHTKVFQRHGECRDFRFHVRYLNSPQRTWTASFDRQFTEPSRTSRVLTWWRRRALRSRLWSGHPVYVSSNNHTIWRHNWLKCFVWQMFRALFEAFSCSSQKASLSSWHCFPPRLYYFPAQNTSQTRWIESLGLRKPYDHCLLSASDWAFGT